MNKVGFYQGCCFQGQDAHMFDTMKKTFSILDIDVVLLEETTCCGGNTIEEESRKLSYAINARNIALAERRGLDLLVSCNTCYMVIAKTKLALDSDDKLREEINDLLKEEGLEYTGKTKIWHIVNFLRDFVGIEKIKSKVKRPLNHLRIASYYGCHILYPKEVAIDDSNNPKSLEAILEALGVEVVNDYEERDTCCGYHAFYTDKTIALKKVDRILVNAKLKGVDAIATPCPLCFKAFDIYQLQLENMPELPAIYLPELMAYAFGLSKEESGLSHHLVELRK